MKTITNICATKRTYQLPEVELSEVVLERGFAGSIEVVEKDEEVEF